MIMLTTISTCITQTLNINLWDTPELALELESFFHLPCPRYPMDLWLERLTSHLSFTSYHDALNMRLLMYLLGVSTECDGSL